MVGNGRQAMSGGIRKAWQRGDTLVEVLICILLVSMILTGAYVTTNRSRIGIRDAQEHAEALKLVQSQLEQLKQNGSVANAPIFSQPAGVNFCMVNAVISTGTGACQQDSGGSPTTDQPAYRLTIQRASCAPDYSAPAGAQQCHKFTVRATWDSIAGNTQATEQIIYRLYQS
jgi:prepilin-type N-terminal cleavage/methylation domain-containing protein